MTSGGSYPLTVEALRCRCGALPVMEWANWGNSHRVICTHCGAPGVISNSSFSLNSTARPQIERTSLPAFGAGVG